MLDAKYSVFMFANSQLKKIKLPVCPAFNHKSKYPKYIHKSGCKRMFIVGDINSTENNKTIQF